MKQPTNVHIATPCHEDWNAMTPAKGGKFCASCSKQVVDFTLMSDAQILQFLSTHSGGLCGRFEAGQLERPLIEPAVSKRKSWYLALVLPFILLLQKSFAQKGERKMGKPMVKTEQNTKVTETVATMGILSMPPVVSEWITVHGILVNEAGEPLEYASVVVKGTSHGSVTDSAGRFSLQVRRGEDSLVLAASAVGYETLEKKVRAEEAGDELVLTLDSAEGMLGEVVVTGYPTTRCTMRSGGISTYRTITHAEKRDSAIRKILRLNPFTVYPNPVKSGGSIQMNFSKSGAWEVQLLNSASALLKTEKIKAVSSGTVLTFQLPQLPAGMYYLRLISEDQKQSYLEKILVN